MAEPDLVQPRTTGSNAFVRRLSQIRPWLGFIVTVPLLLLGMIALTWGACRQTHRQFHDATFMDCSEDAAVGAEVCVRRPTAGALLYTRRAKPQEPPRLEALAP